MRFFEHADGVGGQDGGEVRDGGAGVDVGALQRRFRVRGQDGPERGQQVAGVWNREPERLLGFGGEGGERGGWV